jgi:hypothetical protein
VTITIMMETCTNPLKNCVLISVGVLFLALPTTCLCRTLDHCIEMLRQFTMCASDVTMITHDWVEGKDTPVPDFNVHHQCRNFEKVLDWVDEHRVFVTRSEMVRLDDNVDLPSPP